MDSIVVIDSNDTEHTFKVSRDECKTFIIILGEKHRQRLNLEVELSDEGAEVLILGIIIGKNKDSIILNTFQKHSAPNTKSDLLVKGVFFGKSKFVYRGLIKIVKDAQNTNAFQQEDNIVLSDNVEIDTRPELEIEANDVQCTHAATVAPIDSQQLYYMKTRGLREEEAKAMIIEGFLGEVVRKIDGQNIRSQVKNKIVKLLDKAR